jgi:hypothetical protein
MKRYAIWCGVMVLAAAWPWAGAQEPGEKWVKRVTLEVQEKAGIRRNGYPVSATFPSDKAFGDYEHFRLLDRDKVVPAEFVAVDKRGGVMKVGFHSSHAPFETRNYTVEYGPGVDEKLGTNPKKGFSFGISANGYSLNHPSGLAFVVPMSFKEPGLLKEVRTKKTHYLRPNSTGLFLRLRQSDRPTIVVGGPEYGGGSSFGLPLISWLQYKGSHKIGDDRVSTRVDMEFPISRSWVRVDFTTDDPKGLIEALGVDLNLNIEGEATLVDFGAGTSVYTTLKKGQSAVLRSGSLEKDRPGWQVLVGPTKAPAPFVVMPPDRPSKAEGWAHVMDRQRCTAVAVADFAQERLRSEIAVAADGRLRCEREFDPKETKKTLTFWLHFVNMPVQEGAATSPQSMMNPLQVTVRKQK